MGEIQAATQGIIHSSEGYDKTRRQCYFSPYFSPCLKRRKQLGIKAIYIECEKKYVGRHFLLSAEKAVRTIRA